MATRSRFGEPGLRCDSRGDFAKDFKLRDQIRGAAGSVRHNCAEGFDSGSDNEFIVFLKYARRSASEIQSEIYLALDRKHVDQSSFKKNHDKATETKKIINTLIASCAGANLERNPLDVRTKRPVDYPTMGPS